MSKNKKNNFFSWIGKIKDSFFKNDKNLDLKKTKKKKNQNVNKKKHFNQINKCKLKNKKIYKDSFYDILKKKLINTKKNFSKIFKNFFLKKKIDRSFLKLLKEKMLLSDIGVKTTNYIFKKIKKKIDLKKIKDSNFIKNFVILELKKILNLTKSNLKYRNSQNPYVILVVGINGSGKTTLISKIANLYLNKNSSVVLAAADTFRAAAVEQLKIWGSRLNVPVISGRKNSDPASVVYDSLQFSIKNKSNYLIIDTAGRMHNKVNLMRELNKIVSVIKKNCFDAPHEIMLVIDSCIGQNSFYQAEKFHKNLNLNSISLTKLDGTAKGGIIFAIAKKFSIPIKYITLGESIKDIQKFNSSDFIRFIFDGI